MVRAVANRYRAPVHIPLPRVRVAERGRRRGHRRPPEPRPPGARLGDRAGLPGRPAGRGRVRPRRCPTGAWPAAATAGAGAGELAYARAGRGPQHRRSSPSATATWWPSATTTTCGRRTSSRPRSRRCAARPARSWRPARTRSSTTGPGGARVTGRSTRALADLRCRPATRPARVELPGGPAHRRRRPDSAAASGCSRRARRLTARSGTCSCGRPRAAPSPTSTNRSYGCCGARPTFGPARLRGPRRRSRAGCSTAPRSDRGPRRTGPPWPPRSRTGPRPPGTGPRPDAGPASRSGPVVAARPACSAAAASAGLPGDRPFAASCGAAPGPRRLIRAGRLLAVRAVGLARAFAGHELSVASDRFDVVQPTAVMVPCDADTRLHRAAWSSRTRDGQHVRRGCLPSRTVPFLLVHGLSSNARLWDEVAGRLAAAGHPAYAVDLRSHGESDSPADGLRHGDGRAPTWPRWRRRLGLAAAVVAGQSWGGNVVVRLAADHPSAGGRARPGRRRLDRPAPSFPDWAACERALRPPDIDGMRADDVRRFIAGPSIPTGRPAAVDATLANLRVTDGAGQPPAAGRQAHAHRAQHVGRPADPTTSPASTCRCCCCRRSPTTADGARRRRTAVAKAAGGAGAGRRCASTSAATTTCTRSSRRRWPTTCSRLAGER